MPFKPAPPIRTILRGPQGPVTCLAVSASTIYAGSWDNEVHSWSLADHKPFKRFRGGHNDFVKAVAYHAFLLPSNEKSEPTYTQMLLSGGADGYVVVWNAESAEKLHVLRGHSRGVLDIALQPPLPLQGSGSIDSTTVVVWSAGSDRTIRRWQVGPGKAEALPFVVQQSNDQGAVQSQTEEELVVHDTSVNRLGFTWTESTADDSGALPSQTLRLLTASSDKTAKVFDFTSSDPLHPPILTASFVHPDFVRDVCEMPETGLIATACRDETIRLWRIDDPEEAEEQYDGHFEEVTALCLCEVAGKSVLVSSSIDATVRPWSRYMTTDDLGREGEEGDTKIALAAAADNEHANDANQKVAAVQLTEDEERELAELMDDDD